MFCFHLSGNFKTMITAFLKANILIKMYENWQKQLTNKQRIIRILFQSKIQFKKNYRNLSGFYLALMLAFTLWNLFIHYTLNFFANRFPGNCIIKT